MEYSKSESVFLNPELSENSRFPILFESDNFILKLGKGALLPGYTMLIPKREINSFAELNEQEIAEFQKILTHVSKIFHQNFGHVPMMWENGSAYENAGGFFANSIDHAHMHILPLTPSDQLVKKINKDRNLEAVDILKNFEHYKDSYYLLLRDPQEKTTISRTKDPERQYMRKIIAHQIGTPRAWNWREFANDPNVQEGLKKLAEPFANLQKIFELAKNIPVEIEKNL